MWCSFTYSIRACPNTHICGLGHLRVWACNRKCARLQEGLQNAKNAVSLINTKSTLSWKPLWGSVLSQVYPIMQSIFSFFYKVLKTLAFLQYCKCVLLGNEKFCPHLWSSNKEMRHGSGQVQRPQSVPCWVGSITLLVGKKTKQLDVCQGPVSERRLSENSEYVNPEMRETLGFPFQNGRFVNPGKAE